VDERFQDQLLASLAEFTGTRIRSAPVYGAATTSTK
jgi:hypothetical protein